MFRLDGKVAIVTGGSRGIGRSISVTLAKAGAHVVATYQGNEEAAKETVSLIEGAGGKGEALRFDVSDAEAVAAAIGDVHKRLGRIDILVNNAGIVREGLLMMIKPEQLDAIWATNLNGTIFCSKAAIRPMMRAKTGRIINLSSVVGDAGQAGLAAYSASKAGVIGLTKTLAREYASRGVTVNAVAPGFIDTDMTTSLPDALQTHILEQTPLKRVGTPEEVAATVLFLASDEASYITGQVIRVNGGMYV